MSQGDDTRQLTLDMLEALLRRIEARQLIPGDEGWVVVEQLCDWFQNQRLIAAQATAQVSVTRVAELETQMEYLIDANEAWVEITHCECDSCGECDKMPAECTGTECSKTCSCRECDHCHSANAVAAARVVLPLPVMVDKVGQDAR